MSSKYLLDFLLKLLIILYCCSLLNKVYSKSEESKILHSLVSTCYSCHGTFGNAVGNIKSLSGYDSEKFVLKFNWFLENPNNGGVMHTIAKGFTNEEIKIMANFFSTQK